MNFRCEFIMVWWEIGSERSSKVLKDSYLFIEAHFFYYCYFSFWYSAHIFWGLSSWIRSYWQQSYQNSASFPAPKGRREQWHWWLLSFLNWLWQNWHETLRRTTVGHWVVMRRVLPTDFDIVGSFQVFPDGRVEDKSLGDKNVQYEFVSQDGNVASQLHIKYAALLCTGTFFTSFPVPSQCECLIYY